MAADLELDSSLRMNRISAAHFPRSFGGRGLRGLILGTRSAIRRTRLPRSDDLRMTGPVDKAPLNTEIRSTSHLLASGGRGQPSSWFGLTQQKFGDTLPRAAGALPPGCHRNKGLKPLLSDGSSATAKEPPARF
jgi:hypothetical protein